MAAKAKASVAASTFRLGGWAQRRATGSARLTGEAEAAKENLVAFQQEIARLRDEKVRMVAGHATACSSLVKLAPSLVPQRRDGIEA
jgi:hypothetical protein